MTLSRRLCFSAAAAALLFGAHPATSQNQHDMTFHTVPPCTVVDTRVAGGAFSANETRTYNVVGSASFASQGGSTTGCGIPGFSTGIAQAQAVALAATSISSSGPGYVAANAADQPLAGAVLTIAAGSTLTNTSEVALAQASGIGDIKVQVAGSGSHLLLRVVGYYSKPVQLVWVHPVPGNAAASGAAVLTALAGITNASASKPYVLKIEPGIYDLGTAPLVMKPYVDVEGSGQQATILQGSGSTAQPKVVIGAAFTELRDLQIKGIPASAATGMYGISFDAGSVSSDEFRARRVTVSLSGPGTTTLIGIWTGYGHSEITDTTVAIAGGNGVIGVSCGWGTLKVRNSRITVAGSSNEAYGLQCGNPDLTEVDGLRIEVTGASGPYNAWGFSLTATQLSPVPPPVPITNTTIVVSSQSGSAYGAFFGESDAQLSRSTVRASGSSSVGAWVRGAFRTTIDNSEIAGDSTTVLGPALIGGSKLEGGAASGATCGGVWDESYTFFAGPACP